MRAVSHFALWSVCLACAAPLCAPAELLVADVEWQPLPSPSDPAPAPSRDRVSVTIPSLPSAPRIDGRLDDDAWQAALSTPPWQVNTGGSPAPVQTKAWLGVHGGRLFLAARAEEPNPAGIVAEVTTDGGPAWNDDCLEFFVDGNLDSATVNQIIINTRGVITAIGAGDEWQPHIQRAARVGEHAWFAEFSIPLSDLGLTGATFGIDLCRERRAGGGEVELSCWFPTGGAFRQPERYGIANLPEARLISVSLGALRVGRNKLTCTVRNPTHRRLSMIVRLQWGGEDDDSAAVRIPVDALAPGEERRVALPFDVTRASATVPLRLTLLDSGGRALETRAFSVPVIPPLQMAISRHVLGPSGRHLLLSAVVRLSDSDLTRMRLIAALFDRHMFVRARQELPLPPDGESVLRARLSLPVLAPADYTIHLVLKDARLSPARRLAEQETTLYLLHSPLE